MCDPLHQRHLSCVHMHTFPSKIPWFPMFKHVLALEGILGAAESKPFTLPPPDCARQLCVKAEHTMLPGRGIATIHSMAEVLNALAATL